MRTFWGFPPPSRCSIKLPPLHLNFFFFPRTPRTSNFQAPGHRGPFSFHLWSCLGQATSQAKRSACTLPTCESVLVERSKRKVSIFLSISCEKLINWNKPWLFILLRRYIAEPIGTYWTHAERRWVRYADWHSEHCSVQFYSNFWNPLFLVKLAKGIVVPQSINVFQSVQYVPDSTPSIHARAATSITAAFHATRYPNLTLLDKWHVERKKGVCDH